MRGTDDITKLSKMKYTRISLCKNPADPDARIVLVKSAEEGDGLAKEEGVEVSLTPEFVSAIEKAVFDAIEKSPKLTNYSSGTSLDGKPDPDGKPELKKCVEELVKECNASKTTPKKIKEKVAEIAKFHGTEGPELTDDGTPSQFADAISAMNAVTGAMTQMMSQMVANQQQQQAASAPVKKDEESPEGKPADEKPQVSVAVMKSHAEMIAAAKAVVNDVLKEFGKEPKFK